MSIFSAVGGAVPHRTAFNLNYSKLFNCNFGQLIPVLCEECVPGDSWRVGNQIVVRFEPQQAPFFSDVDVTTHYFFVPYRLLDDNWEQFITGGDLVDDTRAGHSGKVLAGDLVDIHRFGDGNESAVFNKYSLPDYLGLPLGVDLSGVMDYSRRAYNLVFNEFFRDENLQPDEVSPINTTILYRNWKKDYFTSALPFQQKGQSPSFPLVGTLPIDFFDKEFPFPSGKEVSFYGAPSASDPILSYRADKVRFEPVLTQSFYNTHGEIQSFRPPMNSDYKPDSPGYTWGYGDSQWRFNAQNHASVLSESAISPTEPGSYIGSFGQENVYDFSQNNAVDLSNAVVGFDITDLRYAFQVQKFFERNARSGSRYTEFLQAHYGTSPRDDRLQRPEFIGSSYQKVVTSEVLQTSASGESGTRQGNMAGHSMSYGAGYVGRYFCQEFGIILGVMSIMTKAQYFQGVNRQWLRKNRYDFYNPLFANLSEQGIYNGEVYWQGRNGTDSTDDYGVFGFQGMFNEMRVKHDMVCADVRPSILGASGDGLPFYSYWSLARDFANLPTLSEDFIKGQITNPRVFAVTDANHPQIVVNFGNLCRVSRPMPYVSEPGLIDHH